MSATAPYLLPLVPLLIMAMAVWVVATIRRNAAIVDIFWSLFILVGLLPHLLQAGDPPSRGWIVFALATTWAIRLCVHLARRTWNEPEERRYRAIRERNQPGYAWKSLYLVFGLQAVLAWIVGFPLAAAVRSQGGFAWLDVAGAALVAAGIAYEAIADRQLARFKADARNRGQVLDRGLWRYSRHPNYFGECCIWWGFYLVALAADAGWTIVSPLLMTWLLLRISGVTLLEQGIADRRPGYASYAARTNAFLPGPVKPV